MVGGIIGAVDAGAKYLEVKQCFNKGIVSGNYAVSGIATLNTSSNISISNCYNIAQLKTKNGQSAGIAYSSNCNSLTTINSYNYGLLENNRTYGISNKTTYNCYYLNTCGATDSNGTAISSEDLKNLASTLDKAYTINAETGEVTISETEIQNVWTDDTQNINGGYPIFK